MKQLIVLLILSFLTADAFPARPKVGTIYQDSGSQTKIDGPDGTVIQDFAEDSAVGVLDPMGTIGTSGSKAAISGLTIIGQPEIHPLKVQDQIGLQQQVVEDVLFQQQYFDDGAEILAQLTPTALLEHQFEKMSLKQQAQAQNLKHPSPQQQDVSQSRLPQQYLDPVTQTSAKIYAQQPVLIPIGLNAQGWKQIRLQQAREQFQFQQQYLNRILADQQASTEIQAQQHALLPTGSSQQELKSLQQAPVQYFNQIGFQQQAEEQFPAQQEYLDRIQAQQQASAEIQAQQPALNPTGSSQQQSPAQDFNQISFQQQADEQFQSQQEYLDRIQAQQQASAEIQAQQPALKPTGSSQQELKRLQQAQAQDLNQIGFQQQADDQFQSQQEYLDRIRAQQQTTAEIQDQQETLIANGLRPQEFNSVSWQQQVQAQKLYQQQQYLDGAEIQAQQQQELERIRLQQVSQFQRQHLDGIRAEQQVDIEITGQQAPVEVGAENLAQAQDDGRTINAGVNPRFLINVAPVPTSFSSSSSAVSFPSAEISFNNLAANSQESRLRDNSHLNVQSNFSRSNNGHGFTYELAANIRRANYEE